MREVGNGADERAQAISGREKEGGRGGNGCQLAQLGRPRKKNGRRGKKKRRKASGPAGKEMGQQAKMRKGGERNEIPFSFSKSNFQMIFESF